MTTRTKMVLNGIILLLSLTFLMNLPLLAQEDDSQPAPTPVPRKVVVSPDTGFIPPNMDLSHLRSGKEWLHKAEGIELSLPSSFDWRQYGVVTSVKNQGSCGSCYAFASLGCFESKILIDGGSTYDLSEDNVKECEYYHSCCSGGSFYRVASFLSQYGTVLESCDPYLPYHNTSPACGSCAFQQTLLDWRIISGDSVPDTNVLKNYIYNYGPVYTSMWSGADPYDATWRSEFNSYDGSYTLYKPWSGATDHAVLIVGWDDSLTHAGGTGGWIVKNSWGTSWGGTCGYGTEKGYFTIAYGSAAIGKYSSFIWDWTSYDTNGDIYYYDEGGWNYNRGWGDTTAWGLCWFVPTENTYATRIEFWTNDTNTTVDCYLYDDWSWTAPGPSGTLSNLLASKTGVSFTEAGYHSVALDTPVSLTNGDGVAVVVKFQTSTYGYPIPCDADGPIQSQKTFCSHTGANGTWYDMATASGTPGNVAIRLRTSTPLPTPTTTPTPTPTPGATGTPFPGEIYVCDSVLNAVIGIDPTTGNRYTVSDNSTGTGQTFSAPNAITMNSNLELFVADCGHNAIIKVDPVTGDRTVVSGLGTGSGPALDGPTGIVLDAQGNLLVSCGNGEAIISVDPSTGNRTTVSDASTGSGTNFDFPNALTVDSTGDIIVADCGIDAILRVDPSTGDRTIISDSTHGTGTNFVTPSGIVEDANGDFIVTDFGIPAVLKVDPSTGNRTVISDGSTGTGEDLNQPNSIGIDEYGNLIVGDGGSDLYSQDSEDALLSIDPTTGDRTVLSDGSTGVGPMSGDFNGLVISPLAVYYDYEGDTNGWTFTGIRASSADISCTGATSSYDSTRLGIGTDNSTNRFGWWITPGGIPYEANKLYKFTWRLSSSVAQNNMPTIRFRVFPENFSYSSAMTLQSANPSSNPNMPTATPKDYNQYVLPLSSSNLVPAFDVYDFDPVDAGNVYLEELKVCKLHIPSTGWTSVSVPSFGSWSAVTSIPPYYSVTSGTSGGLQLSSSVSEAFAFGFWNSPLVTSMAPDTLYRVVFTVSSSDTSPPNGMFRIASEDLQVSYRVRYYLAIAPDSDGEDYPVYFETHNFVTGQDDFYLAYEIADFENSQGGTITLTSVDIESHPVIP